MLPGRNCPVMKLLTIILHIASGVPIFAALIIYTGSFKRMEYNLKGVGTHKKNQQIMYVLKWNARTHDSSRLFKKRKHKINLFFEIKP